MPHDITAAFVGLTDKQRLFVEAKLTGSNNVQAARAAGFASPKTDACKIAKLPIVQEAIARAQAITAHAVGRTREQLDEMLMEAWNSAINATEQVAVVRELGKLHGLYAPTQHEHKVDQKVEHVHELAGLSTDDLRRVAAGDLSMLPNPDVIEGQFEEVKR